MDLIFIENKNFLDYIKNIFDEKQYNIMIPGDIF